MQTIRLKISDKVFKNFMWLLKKFNKEEIQVINEDENYLSVKEYLHKELDALEKNSNEFIDVDQLEEGLEKTIQKHEA